MPFRDAKERARGRRGALVVVAGMLLGSAALRIGLGADQAIALTQAAPTGDLAAGVNAEGPCVAPPEIQAVLAALEERGARLEEREGALVRRMQALASAEAEITRRMEDLVAAEEALRETIALADSAAENDIARLVAVYENMKPKDAALLFEQMDPTFASGFLARMSPEAAAGIMTGLDPQTAYLFSAILAGRNAEVPRQ